MNAALSRLKHGFESRRERQQYQRVSGQAGSASRTFLKRKAISAVHQHRVCGPVNDLHRRPGWCGGCSGVGRAANRSPCPTIEVAQSTAAKRCPPKAEVVSSNLAGSARSLALLYDFSVDSDYAG